MAFLLESPPFLSEKVEDKIENLKKMITESVEIERFKVKDIEGMYNYKVHFDDGRSLEIIFDGMIKLVYSSFPSFKIYLDGKLLDLNNNEKSLYLFTRDVFHKSNEMI